jgi:hypothetical protein
MFTKIRTMWGMNRRAAVVVMVAASGTLIAGFGAITIDLGNMYIWRCELQRTADAAALGAASAFFTNDGLKQAPTALAAAALQRGNTVATQNPVNSSTVSLKSSDVALAHYDFVNPALSASSPLNAVQVTACRTASNNGAVPLIFAGIWGKTATEMTAAASAAVDDRVSGYTLQGNTGETGRFMPFTIPVAGYWGLLKNGPDAYSFNGTVVLGADGVREVLMFPWKWDNTGYSGGAGDFGTLDMNRPNNGALDLADQIRSGGAWPSDVQAELHTPTLTFYDAAHPTTPITYACSGTPGMKTTIQAELAAQKGKIFGFFLNNNCVINGQNATYSICGVFFARIMAVDLNGGANRLGLIVQPVGYTDNWVATSKYAPSTSLTLGRIRLVK